MAGTFFGINVAYSGLNLQRRAMDLAAYNIANASDPAYKRQRVLPGEGIAAGQTPALDASKATAAGSGVRADAIQRVYDALVEQRLQEANGLAAQWEFTSSTLQQLESILGEPSDAGLQNELDKFWSSWNTVANTPDSEPLRSLLLQDAENLCGRIRELYADIDGLREDLNPEVSTRVDSINDIAHEIARLNGEIESLASNPIARNDVLNSRDALVGALAKLMPVSQHGQGGADFILSVNGQVLVQGTIANELTCQLESGSQVVRWSNSGDELTLANGELGAIYEMRDSTLADCLAQLDEMASCLAESVNALHLTGKTLDGGDGGNFFTPGSTARDISLDASIIGNPRLVAASASGAVGDGDIAAQIAALKSTAQANGLTVDEMYRSLVTDIGEASAVAQRQSEFHALSADHLTTQQQSISGVSLDEEMADIIVFQQAYNAAARTLTVMDEMLGVLIQQTGAVGR